MNCRFYYTDFFEYNVLILLSVVCLYQVWIDFLVCFEQLLDFNMNHQFVKQLLVCTWLYQNVSLCNTMQHCILLPIIAGMQYYTIHTNSCIFIENIYEYVMYTIVLLSYVIVYHVILWSDTCVLICVYIHFYIHTHVYM